jgi:DNA-directed RNA polymerase subunit omega
MARITVEDCFKKLGNKFELSVLASYRAKEISKGAATEIERNNDKNSVLALREIASEHVDISKLRHAYLQSLQLYIPSNDVESKVTEQEAKAAAKDDAIPSEDLIEREFISVDDGENSTLEDLEIDSVVDDISEGDLGDE